MGKREGFLPCVSLRGGGVFWEPPQPLHKRLEGMKGCAGEMHWNDKKEALRAGRKHSQCSPMNVIQFLPLIYWVVNVLTVIFGAVSDGKGEPAGCTGEGEVQIAGRFEKRNQAMGRSWRQNSWWCCPSLTEWTWARTQLDSVIAGNTAGNVGRIWSREETDETPAQFCRFPQSILLLHAQVLSKPHSKLLWNLLCHGPLAPLLLTVIPPGIFFPTKGLLIMDIPTSPSGVLSFPSTDHALCTLPFCFLARG